MSNFSYFVTSYLLLHLPFRPFFIASHAIQTAQTEAMCVLLCSYVCVAFLRNEHNQIGHFTCMFFYHYSIIICNSLKDGAQLQTIYGHFACETRCVHNQKLTRSTSSSTMFIFYLILSHCKNPLNVGFAFSIKRFLSWQSSICKWLRIHYMPSYLNDKRDSKAGFLSTDPFQFFNRVIPHTQK